MTTLKRRSFEAAATPWSAASSQIKTKNPTLLFETQAPTSGSRAISILTGPAELWLTESEGRFFEGPTGRRVDDPVAWMKEQHRPCESLDEMLPFVGGLAGYLSFEFGWHLDQVNAAQRSHPSPKLWVGRFDSAALFDHDLRRWQVVAKTEQKARALQETIEAAPAAFEAPAEVRGERSSETEAAVYEARARAAIEAIYGGEFFEVNYTERFFGTWSGDRRLLYDRLRRAAPGNYGGLIDTEDVFLASISPEQFLSVSASGRIVTRPIKGTRPRGATAEEDARLARELATSEKDRAENVMIVDLMRNDLTRVSRPGTVCVTELCGLHSFSSVHHLVSTVEGQLLEGFSALDAFLSSFPAGSITGAPKLRSMEWIATHEGTARGPYTGSMFYWSDHGRLDSNVLIRTAVLHDGLVEYGAGGAVVADSSPEAEYTEALWKARPFFVALEEE